MSQICKIHHSCQSWQSIKDGKHFIIISFNRAFNCLRRLEPEEISLVCPRVNRNVLRKKGIIARVKRTIGEVRTLINLLF